MPPIFKALATITVWILFISGCVATVVSPITRITVGEVRESLIAWAIGVACLVLAVVCMKLRQTLE